MAARPAIATVPIAERKPSKGGTFDGRTRAVRRRREVIAEMVADLGRPPDATERHLIATVADLTISREALAAAQLRGEPVDSMVLLKTAGLITRTIAALRGKASGKPRPGTAPTIRERLAAAR
jgi:hypothetical protein